MAQASQHGVWGDFSSFARSFLDPDFSLQACAAALAAFVVRRTPAVLLMLIRRASGDLPSEYAVWSDAEYPFAELSDDRFGAETVRRLTDLFHPDTAKALHNVPAEATDPAFLPDSLRAALHLLAVPVPGLAGPSGVVLAGKPRAAGGWTAEEKADLHCAVVPAALWFHALEHAGVEDKTLRAILEQSGTAMYVTDPHTDVILYMNRTMKEMFRLRNPEGKVCWKVLQVGRDRRCDCCPVPLLLQRQGEPFVYRWEERNALAGKTFENYDSLIRWTDGSLVHLQQSIDITGFCRLPYPAEQEVESLTGRADGLSRLAVALHETAGGGPPLTVCMMEAADEPGNDARHGVCAPAIPGNLEAPHFAFRYDERTWVVIWRGLSRNEAVRRTEELFGVPEDSDRTGVYSGFFEVPSGFGLVPSEVLTNAEQHLYERKRRFRIRESERRLEETAASHAARPFSYDASRLYDALAASTDAHMYAYDVPSGRVRYSRSMVEAFDLPGEFAESGVALWNSHIHPADKRTVQEAEQSVLDGRSDGFCLEYRIRNRRGEWERVRSRGRLERDASGAPSLFAGFVTPLEHKDRIDHVTGLYNKIKLEEDVSALLETDPGREITLLVLGVDGFKHVNDLHDREFGDEILRRIGRKIAEMLPARAGIYRLDSDEFGIVLPGSKTEAERLYRSVSAGFRFQQEHEGKKYFCTLSAGGASCPEDAANCLDLLQCAVGALRRAKEGGKDRIVFFNRSFMSRRRRSLELVELLRESMDRNYSDFFLVYQPQVAVQTRTLTGAEALTRWRCEKYGSVSPAEFVPLLEQSGLIVPFGKWVFRKAAEQCREWVRLKPDIVIGVNLSYLQVASDDMLPFIRHTLKDLRLDPANLVLEFTESCMIGENARIHTVFGELRDLGLRIAMDDFGTGYSSLGMLKDSPADVVKIDRIFVRDILQSRFDATFIRFVVALCHDVGIRVCLEGVESEEELELVRSMGLDYLQGYLFGKPEPPDVFERQFLGVA